MTCTHTRRTDHWVEEKITGLKILDGYAQTAIVKHQPLEDTINP